MDYMDDAIEPDDSLALRFLKTAVWLLGSAAICVLEGLLESLPELL
jgi:hypothetical protein